MPRTKGSINKKGINKKKVSQTVAVEISAPSVSEPKPGYNKFGVCLDCNNNNPDCTHNSLSEGAGGKIVCNICGIAVN